MAASAAIGVADARSAPCKASSDVVSFSVAALPEAVATKVASAVGSPVKLSQQPGDSSRRPEGTSDCQLVLVTMMDGTLVRCHLPREPTSTVTKLKDTIEAMTDGKVLASELVLVAGTEVMEDGHTLDEYGYDHGVSAVVQVANDGGKTRRALIAKTDAAKAVLSALAAIDEHAGSKCKFGCLLDDSKFGGVKTLCKVERVFLKCTSPDDNPYGPCSNCRMSGQQRYVPQHDCPVAVALNEELIVLNRLAHEQAKTQVNRGKT